MVWAWPGQYGIMEAAVPTQRTQPIRTGRPLAAGVNVIVKSVKKLALNKHRSVE